MRSILSSEHLLKNINGNCLVSQRPQTVILVEINKRLTKKLKKKNREMRSGALKSFNIFLEVLSTTHMQSYIHAQERPHKALNFQLLLTMWLCTGRKQRLKQSCELSVEVLKTCSNIYTHTGTKSPLAMPGDLLV